MSKPNEQHNENDGRRDFDFFMGNWDSQHRRLRERLQGSQDWEEFSGRSEAHRVLGDLGNFDEITMNRAGGETKGMTVRLFDPATRQWSIYWADSTKGVLQAPMIGEFTDGRGEFYDREVFAGKSIFSRFIWSAITASSCRWEQAFSADGGKSWETNWIMDFTRRT